MSRFAFGEDSGPGKSEPAISEEEAILFGMAIAEAVREPDCRRFLELVDFERIFDRATRIPGLPELDEARQFFKSRAMGALRRSGGIHAEILKAIQQGGSYESLHFHSETEDPSVLIRLNVPNDGGLNYHCYSLIRNRHGAVVADDIFFFLTAEELWHWPSEISTMSPNT